MAEEQKAYDLKELLDALKVHGLDVAEDVAKLVVGETLSWLQKSAQRSENTYDDILVAVIPLFQAEIDKALDKIDGKVG